MRLTKAIITSRESVKLERGLGRLLLSCKFGLHFLFLLINAFFQYCKLAVFSAQIPHLVHYYFMRCVFQQTLEVYIHLNFLILECHCGMSVRFTEEFSMTELITRFSFFTGLFLTVEQLVGGNACAAVPVGGHSTHLSIFSL